MPEEVTIRFAGTEMGTGHLVRSTANSRLFEIVWDFYVAYSVTNESYTTRDESEVFSGRFARLYSKSHFLDYISRATFACKEYPGPLQHFHWSPSAISLMWFRHGLLGFGRCDRDPSLQ